MKNPRSKWHCEKIMLADDAAKVAEVMSNLSQVFCHFIVVNDAHGHAVALLSTADFLGLVETLRASRFPGDSDPSQVNLQQLLQGPNGYDFYAVDTKNPPDRLYAKLAPLPPRHVLVLENGRVQSVIPRVDFEEWRETLRAQAGLDPHAL